MGYTRWYMTTVKEGGTHRQSTTYKNGTTNVNILGDCKLLPRYVSATRTYSYVADKDHSRKHQIQMDGIREKGLRGDGPSCWKRCSPYVFKILKRVHDPHRRLKETT